MKYSTSYGEALLAGFEWVLSNDENVFVLGQGLWSPWYVGNSMTDLDKKFGKERIIDTPVSEAAVTGAGVGAALAGKRPIVVHPRMDFMLYAMDPVVNQAAKWSHMMGGEVSVPLTVRAIINRGGEQGAQHSQALHSWFCHVPGLRVVMPYSVSDARNLLISSVRCNDPVIFIDDRWLYDTRDDIDEVVGQKPLEDEGPLVIRSGSDVTLVAAGYSTHLCMEASKILSDKNISAEVIDVRVLAPLDPGCIIRSVKQTGRLICVDGGWAPCGFSAEVLASVLEGLDPTNFLSAPARITLPFSPAPCSKPLEEIYYPTADDICQSVFKMLS